MLYNYDINYMTLHVTAPFSCLPCLEYLRPRALILLRLCRYTSRLLTYLLTVYFKKKLIDTAKIRRALTKSELSQSSG